MKSSKWRPIAYKNHNSVSVKLEKLNLNCGFLAMSEGTSEKNVSIPGRNRTQELPNDGQMFSPLTYKNLGCLTGFFFTQSVPLALQTWPSDLHSSERWNSLEYTHAWMI